MCEVTLAESRAAWPIPVVSMTSRLSARSALPVLLVGLCGCGGAQAGGQTGEESGGGCVFTTSPIRDDEASPLGFSPADVRSLLRAEERAKFEWRQDAVLRYGPESGEGEVTVSVRPVGSARWAQVDPANSASFCADHVRVPVKVTLETAGGAFDESFEAHLVATSADEASVLQVVPSSDLRGAFAFDPESLGTRRFSRLDVDLRFGEEAFAGQLLAGVESRNEAAGVASFQPMSLACWGDVSSLPSCAE